MPSGFSKIPSTHSLMCSLQHSGAQGSPILLLFYLYTKGNGNLGVKQSARGKKEGDFLNAGHCCGSGIEVNISSRNDDFPQQFIYALRASQMCRFQIWKELGLAPNLLTSWETSGKSATNYRVYKTVVIILITWNIAWKTLSMVTGTY